MLPLPGYGPDSVLSVASDADEEESHKTAVGESWAGRDGARSGRGVGPYNTYWSRTDFYISGNRVAGFTVCYFA